MKILVTGSGGFLGRHLVPALEAQGHAVVALDSASCDLARAGALDPWAEQSFGQIYHLAAWTRAGTFCRERGGEQWLRNEAINLRVLEFWSRHQPAAKLVAFGTSVAYEPGVDELREENYLAGQPSNDYLAYASSKRSLLVGLQSLERQYGMEFLYLVPSTLYGPNYHLDGRPLHFVYDIARKIVAGRRFGTPVTLWGDGSQRRELVYVDDAVHWIVRLAGTCSGEIVNLGQGGDQSIREIAEILCSAVGYDFSGVEFDATAFVGARSKVLSTDRLDALWSTRPRTSLAVGLRATARWVEEHLEEIAPE